MHENLDTPTIAESVETINLFNSLGIDNQITELDVSVYNNYSQKNGLADYSQVDRKIFIKQDCRCRDFFNAFKLLKGKITGVTSWNHSDDYSWLSKPNKIDALLLFDRNLKAEPAFWE